MASQKSLIILALMAVVLVICQQVRAYDSDDDDEIDYEDPKQNVYLAAAIAMKAVNGKEPIGFEKTKEHLELINTKLDDELGGTLMTLMPELSALHTMSGFYLETCKVKSGPFDLFHGLGGSLLDKLLEDERQGKNRVNIVSFMEECKKRRSGKQN